MGKGANQPGRGTCIRESETIEAQSVADAIGEPTLRGAITSGDHSPDAGPAIRSESAVALTQDRPCAAGAQSFWRRGGHLELGCGRPGAGAAVRSWGAGRPGAGAATWSWAARPGAGARSLWAQGWPLRAERAAVFHTAPSQIVQITQICHAKTQTGQI